MKEKILKILFYFIALFCLLSFLTIRIHKAPRLVGIKKVINCGDLGLETMIKDFLVPLPPIVKTDVKNILKPYRSSDKHPEFSEADLFIAGDSYFYFPRHITFPERLNDTLNKKVYFEDTKNPYQIFILNNYKKGDKKYLIYEMSERFVHLFFSNKIMPEEFPLMIEKKPSTIKILNFNAAENKYNRLFQISILTHDIYKYIQTARFHLFGYISETTPLYNVDPPWLFYYETVNNGKSSIYYKHTRAEIDSICNNFLFVKEELLKRYNIELIVLIIPNKISIYHEKFIKEEYNDFLPRLYEGFNSRNINYIELYNEYKNSEEVLYYGTDTHWNKKGIDIALEKTIQLFEKLKDDNILYPGCSAANTRDLPK